MICNIQKEAVAKAFSKGSRYYDAVALIQKEIACRLIQLIPEGFHPDSILDIGCGTGNVIQEIRKRWGDTPVLGVDIAPQMIEVCQEKWSAHSDISFKVMDIETEVPEKSFDLILSNCCFQWFQNPKNTIRAILSLVPSKGILMFSLFTQDSYREIKEAMANCGIDPMNHFLNLPTQESYHSFLQSLDGIKVQHHASLMEESFAHPLRALQSIAKIGASFKYQTNYKPLTKMEINSICREYDRSFSNPDNGVRLSYSISYFIVEKI